MIPSDLLRYKIDYKNNKIHPLLCSLFEDSKDLEIASQIIQAFEYCFNNRLIKEKLDQLLKDIEFGYKDFKLVRGLSTILERGCIFRPVVQACSKDSELINSEHYSDLTHSKNNLIENISAIDARKAVFEESSRQGLAIDKIKRESILHDVSIKLRISANTLSKTMWSDLEENSTMIEFTPISARQLLLMYNVSLVQTLLFGCVQMKVQLQSSLNKGTLWKELLRNVKRLGLMYWLDSIEEVSNDEKVSQPGGTNYKIICTIEGALNVLKLTDRYGNAISKLFPYIVKSQEWNVSGDILRTTSNGKRLIYKFEISHDTYPNSISHLGVENIILHNIPASKRSTSYRSINPLKTSEQSELLFDSKIERIFSQQFELMQTGWKIEREPEPIITSQKTAFIPDFVLSKFDFEIIVEIIGFWTKEYLERKISKIYDVVQKKKNENEQFFMILVINYENLMSYEIKEREKFTLFRNNDDDNNILITSYKQNKLYFKDIIAYLKRIENQYLKHQFLDKSNGPDLIREIADLLYQSSSSETDIISLDELDQIIQREIQDNKFSKVRLIDVLEKNANFKELFKKEISNHGYIIIKDFIFKKKFLATISHQIKNISTLSIANDLMKSKDIPEKIYIDLLTFLGFRIDWIGLDISKAKLVKINDSTNPDLI